MIRHFIFATTLLASLAACAPSQQGAEVAHHQAGEEEPIAFRVAFMSGHVAAGLALYRAGAPDEAAPHLLHPVSEGYAHERAGLDALGFDSAPFEGVSAALEAGESASAVEPMLAAAEANLASVRIAAGGEPAAIVDYLMDMVITEYTIGVTDGVVTDAGEYQDAFGFSVVARDTLPQTALFDAARAELDALIAFWPDNAPLAASEPASVNDVVAQAQRVQAVLPGLASGRPRSAD